MLSNKRHDNGTYGMDRQRKVFSVLLVDISTTLSLAALRFLGHTRDHFKMWSHRYSKLKPFPGVTVSVSN